MSAIYLQVSTVFTVFNVGTVTDLDAFYLFQKRWERLTQPSHLNRHVHQNTEAEQISYKKSIFS